MRLDQIGFADSQPATVTVTLTLAGAAAVTKIFSRITPTTEETGSP